MINGGILVLAAPLVALLAAAVARWRHVSGPVFLIYLALGAWALAAIGVTLFPLPYQRELIEVERSSQFLSNNLVLFATIGPAIDGGLGGPQLRVVAANVLMFVPLGFFVSFLPARRPSLRRVAAVAIIASCGIEVTQWLISVGLGYTYRNADVDDVVLNTLGAGLGFLAYRVAGPSVEAILGRGDRAQRSVERHRAH
jgi:glycopeptide antibiotics resistance protein